MSTNDELDTKLREILGEDDWMYTDKPYKLAALIRTERVSELEALLRQAEVPNNLEDIEQGPAVKAVYASHIEARIAKLKGENQ